MTLYFHPCHKQSGMYGYRADLVHGRARTLTTTGCDVYCTRWRLWIPWGSVAPPAPARLGGSCAAQECVCTWVWDLGCLGYQHHPPQHSGAPGSTREQHKTTQPVCGQLLACR